MRRDSPRCRLIRRRRQLVFTGQPERVTGTGEIISFDQAQREKPPRVGQHVSVAGRLPHAALLAQSLRADHDNIDSDYMWAFVKPGFAGRPCARFARQAADHPRNGA